jgi:hypothetical protein
MNVAEILSARLIGTMFVERGLLSESQIRVALEIQRETGQQLGQILVDRFGISRQELASVVADQWADIGKSTPQVDAAANESWRKLGEIFVERGFVTQEQLDQALARQRETGERVGEALVAQGSISKFELAGALAEQQSALEAGGASGTPAVETNVVHLGARIAEAELQPTTEDESALAEPGDDVEELLSEAAAEPAVEESASGVEANAALEGDPFEGEPEAEPELEPVNPDEAQPRLSIAPDPDRASEVEPEQAPAAVDAAVPEPEPEEAPEGEPELEGAHELEGAYEIEGAPELERVPEPVQVEPVEPVEPAVPDLAAIWQSEQADELVHVPDETPDSQDAWVAFASTTTGYRLVHLTGPIPAVGVAVHVPEAGELVVLRRGPSPIPLDRRTCVFLEQPVRSDAAHG